MPLTAKDAASPTSRVRERLTTYADCGTRAHLLSEQPLVRGLDPARDLPAVHDPSYRARRCEISVAALAWRPGRPTPLIKYTDAEHHVWQTVCQELFPSYERDAISEFREGVERLGLPRDHVPSLDDVSARLEPLTGFRYAPAAARMELRGFYGSLRDWVFHATQYVRHSGAPLCTPEPDIIHDVIGHGHLLATPTFSELHRLAGEATHRLRDDDNVEFLSKVFWFSLEVGVVIEDGHPRAYGAGLLSSLGKTDRFRNVEHQPLDLVRMGSTPHDTTAYQPILYRADSVDEVREVVGGFFATCTDESVAELRADAKARASVRRARHGARTPLALTSNGSTARPDPRLPGRQDIRTTADRSAPRVVNRRRRIRWPASRAEALTTAGRDRAGRPPPRPPIAAPHLPGGHRAPIAGRDLLPGAPGVQPSPKDSFAAGSQLHQLAPVTPVRGRPTGPSGSQPLSLEDDEPSRLVERGTVEPVVIVPRTRPEAIPR